jgi:hypothetical protein
MTKKPNVQTIVPITTPVNPRDPLDINTRLYHHISKLLDELDKRDAGETITLRERLAAIIAIGRLQVMFMGLRKENKDNVSTGSTVRKYTAAFKANDAGRRKKIAGPSPEPEPDIADIFRDDEDDGDELH